MKRLFNEYLAEIQEAQSLTKNFRKSISEVFFEADRLGYDLRDLESILLREVLSFSSERILCQAMNKRKKERNSNAS